MRSNTSSCSISLTRHVASAVISLTTYHGWVQVICDIIEHLVSQGLTSNASPFQECNNILSAQSRPCLSIPQDNAESLYVRTISDLNYYQSITKTAVKNVSLMWSPSMLIVWFLTDASTLLLAITSTEFISALVGVYITSETSLLAFKRKVRTLFKCTSASCQGRAELHRGISHKQENDRLNGCENGN